MKSSKQNIRTIGARTAAAFVAAGALLVSAGAQATVYQVRNSARDALGIDGVCSLREAIRAANTRQQVDSCPAGTDGWNEIDIIGEAATTLNLALTDRIDITSNIWIIAQQGPGFRQSIVGNRSGGFRVQPGAFLGMQSVKVKGFTSTPLTVLGGVVPNRGFLRGQLTLTDCEVAENHGANSISQTMGISSVSGEVVIYSSSIHDNDGAIKGGGIVNQDGRLDVNGSTIYNNKVDQYGGAIHNSGNGATASIYNSTLTGNTAKLGGGGLYSVSGASADVIWSTITANASQGGGGIDLASGVVRIKRSVVSGNKNTGPFAGIDCKGVLTSQGYNLLERCDGTVSATGDIRDKGAALGALSFPTGTNWYLPAYHTPGAASPAVNAIPSGTEECSSFFAPDDEIRNHRLVGGKCDMGAIERQ